MITQRAVLLRGPSTWEALQSLGFTSGLVADGSPCFRYGFGNLELHASVVMGRWFREEVRVSGIFRNGRILAEIDFGMPLGLSSDVCAAWLAFHLDLPLAVQPNWLVEGRLRQDLLPWRARTDEYNKRPRCTALRNWLRLGLKELGGHIALADPTSNFRFYFGGEIFSAVNAKNIVRMLATGDRWSIQIDVPVQSLSMLPKRLIGDAQIIDIWDGGIRVGRRLYKGIVSFIGSL